MTWYSKRIALAVAYKTCELSMIQDKSEDFSDTFEFLKKRVDNVVEADNLIHSVIFYALKKCKIAFNINNIFNVYIVYNFITLQIF